MKVLGLVPACGGSKGVPHQNLRAFAGKPLLQHTAEMVKRCRRLDRVVLSTDDEEIASLGRTWGLDVPFRRSAELEQDTATSLSVVWHALSWLEERGDFFDAVCLLQPRSPLRRPEDVDGCIELLESKQADAVVTVLPVPPEHNPHWVYFRCEDDCIHLATGESAPIPRRQDLPPAFQRDGSIYVTRRDVVLVHNSLYGRILIGYEVDPRRSVNLDSLEDWERGDRLVRQLAEAATAGAR